MYNAPMPIPVSVELNPQFQKALDAIASGKNLFITGKAGTGKSTLLQYFRKNAPGKIVVLAPTGVAALNVQGETIHSFFGFKPDITADKIKKKKGKKGLLYREVDRIVIDEISMVRADLLDHEGNGRLARVVASLMALQAGRPINFERIKKQKKQAYFKAVQAGLKRDYGPMEVLFNELVKSGATS